MSGTQFWLISFYTRSSYNNSNIRDGRDDCDNIHDVVRDDCDDGCDDGRDDVRNDVGYDVHDDVYTDRK